MARRFDKIEIPEFNEKRPYVLWRRVSTEHQGESGLGLEAQLTIAKTFMRKDPAEMFTDVFSGTKLRQCKSLQSAIKYCKDNDCVLVIAKSDRFRCVQDALEVMDAIGERNLIFCDLPTTDRFVLTIMWAMWERQAIMGRINTKIALAERKRQIEEDGGFISKSGNFCSHLGNEKGVDMTPAQIASINRKIRDKEEWRKTGLFAWVELQIIKGRSRKEIVAEAQAMYEKSGGDKNWSTREGRPLSKATLARWVKDILPVI